MRTLSWGIIGTGLIAKRFAAGIAASECGRLVAVASRSAEAGASFAAAHPVGTVHVGYQRLLDDPRVQAVYISTPHPSHAEWAIKAARAGKHVLVEKPMAMNRFEAMAAIEAAEVHGVFLMEAFMYRCHPQTAAILDIVRSGRLGEVRALSASFSYSTCAPDDSRFFAQELGGGGILDVGCYPVSMARLIAGAVAGKPFDEPVEVKGSGALGRTGTDDWAAAVLKFPSGLVAQVSTGLRVAQDEVVRVYGSEASLLVESPWAPGIFSAEPALVVRRNYAAERERIAMPGDRHLYAYEADAVARAVHQGGTQAPEMGWDDSLGNMRALDRWRAEIGLVYDLERGADHAPLTVSGCAPARRAGTVMPTGSIPGIAKPLSRLAIGCDSNGTMPETAVLFDEYLERGGNVFDTSFAYGANGAPERNLGQWIRARGIREQVVVIAKGANPPHAHPEGLTRELQGSLERLQVDHADLYLIHRDNLAVSIEEWVDALEANRRAGRMVAYGVSNFTLPRVIAAQAYAARKGYPGLAAVSNQLSLAEMLQPPWDLCVSSGDQAFRAWLRGSGMALIPWSSQARGFFTARASRADRADPELTRCWYSEGNFARKERAERLARERGVEPTAIALAYVLAQPFPTFPLVGPKSLREIRSTFAALEISLTAAEVTWLESGEAAAAAR